ncbi:hypothetical protein MCEMAEM6B_00624 [Mycobacteriaceae bacterium]
MAYTSATRKARTAAREAAVAARRAKLDEARANLRDLNDFLNASQQLAVVDLWLDSKTADLHAQAEARRSACRALAGIAISSMHKRGMTIAEIARMVGLTQETLSGYMSAARELSTVATED